MEETESPDKTSNHSPDKSPDKSPDESKDDMAAPEQEEGKMDEPVE